MHVILTLPLSEMYAIVGSAIACDRLQLYGNNSLCDRLPSAICDPQSSAIIWKTAFTTLSSRSYIACEIDFGDVYRSCIKTRPVVILIVFVELYYLLLSVLNN